MSLDTIKSQINIFLKSDLPEVLAIKGAWGSGKTYTWNKVLLEAKSRNEISFERYSYISLFGINSLEALKYAAFENSIKRNLIGTTPSLKTLKENAKAIFESSGRKLIGFIKEGPYVRNFSNAVTFFSSLALSKTIVCIDDLERIGKGLPLKDLLGYISFLKEQRNCKIVILLNEGEEGLDDYFKYKEKVVDIELKFAPSPAECASIAYTGSGELYDYLRNLSQELEIKNIRILKKIENLFLLVEPYVKKYETETVERIFRSLALFSWCYYSASDETPPLEIVLDIANNFYDNKAVENSNYERWRIMLSDYGFTSVSDMDLVLLEIIESGYLERSIFEEISEKKNKEVLASKLDLFHTEAWRLYHESFENNEEEVISSIYESFKKNVQNITPINLNGAVTLFRNLNLSDRASELIDYYMEARKNETELFNLNGSYIFGDMNDVEIRRKFSDFYIKSKLSENIEAVFMRLVDRGALREEDEIVLANTSVDDYFRIFKSQTGQNLPMFVRECLRFGRYINANENQIQIGKRAKEALKRIAKESKLNWLRVKKFGIDIDD
ncbi:P-loop NTPase fold protein [Leptospira adleri]|uniref:KAP NTPase domain-containing protein n=1 Tax=Leptospira adleri TaxID=2023186 RepID=A0ABX4NV86_9LEPT|nr:P-loop NTPase fold protein [Leptospira adleri]PJZ59680.1 hypothetical protein CH376_22430 [Leptospira adleri]